MNRRAMIDAVLDELSHIPRANRGSAQNVYRMAYWAGRMNSLGRRPQIARSASTAHIFALQVARRYYAEFVPNIIG
jgi:hypothetical protein